MPVLKRANVQGDEGGKRAGTIDWSEHLEAYKAYVAKWGSDQSPEQIDQRGGFSYDELLMLLGREPATWKPRSS